MATPSMPQSSKAVKGYRKPIPSIDLTAMVDLAFLLITFFMLTTSLSKMNSMDIAKPVPIDDLTTREPWPASKTLTILLGRDNIAAYYLGEARNAKIEISSTSKMKEVFEKSKQKVVGNMYVIIKPTSNSKYENFVGVLNDIFRAGINTYAIDDKYLMPEEQALLSSNRL